MAEIVRRLKIYRLLVGRPCAHCGDELALGEAGAVCEACESAHHERCWDQKNGCGNKDCVNAPLRELKAIPRPLYEESVKPLRPGESRCPFCGDIINNQFCVRCSQPVLSAETGVAGMPPGAFVTTRAPEAGEAIKYAIIGIFCLPFVFGFLAIRSGSRAKEQIAQNPRLEGAGLATFAQVLGAIELALTAIFFLRLLSGMPPY